MAAIAIVTGAGDGLGRELAVGLADAGYQVVAADLDQQSAERCARVLEARGVPAHPVGADVRNPDDVARIAAVARELGGPRVLVNNAGGWTPQRQYPQAQAAEWAATITLNLTAPMLLSQLVLEPMRELGGGAIVNIASSGGIGFAPYGSPEYGAAKAGLIRFTASLGTLEQSHRVRMTCVAPDWIGLARAHAQWAGMTPAERAASRPLIPPADVVAVVLHLVESGAGGTVVEMCGGEPPRVHAPPEPGYGRP